MRAGAFSSCQVRRSLCARYSRRTRRTGERGFRCGEDWDTLDQGGARKSVPTHDAGAAGVQQVLFVQGHVEVGREEMEGSRILV